ncbi:MAG: hypothetical protein KF774_01075 [Planctomyces sp.]|nr:hypothetical protein [Planctomyces sp.]
MSPEISRQTSSGLVLWILLALLTGWALTWSMTLLPARARPLFLLPLFYGLIGAVLLTQLATATAVRRLPGVAALTVALLTAGFGWSVRQGYLRSRDEIRRDRDQAGQRILALEMLRQTAADDPGLIRRYEEELDSGGWSWPLFLNHRFRPFGAWTSDWPRTLFASELLLTAVGAAAGLRLGAPRGDSDRPPASLPLNEPSKDA